MRCLKYFLIINVTQKNPPSSTRFKVVTTALEDGGTCKKWSLISILPPLAIIPSRKTSRIGTSYLLTNNIFIREKSKPASLHWTNGHMATVPAQSRRWRDMGAEKPLQTQINCWAKSCAFVNRVLFHPRAGNGHKMVPYLSFKQIERTPPETGSPAHQTRTQRRWNSNPWARTS